MFHHFASANHWSPCVLKINHTYLSTISSKVERIFTTTFHLNGNDGPADAIFNLIPIIINIRTQTNKQFFGQLLHFYIVLSCLQISCDRQEDQKLLLYCQSLVCSMISTTRGFHLMATCLQIMSSKL